MSFQTEFDFMFISAVRGVGAKVEAVIPGSSEWLVAVAVQTESYAEMLEFWGVIRQELNGFKIDCVGKRKAQQVARAREAFSSLVSAVRCADGGQMQNAHGWVHRAWSQGWAGVR